MDLLEEIMQIPQSLAWGGEAPGFFVMKKTAQKHGYKSVPDSIAGLSESGVNAEHTGKSCSRLELVVRECGLMLQGMVSVFLIGGLALIYSAESVLLPRRLGSRREEAGNLYTGILYFLLTNLHSGRNIRDIHSRKENGILPWKDSCFVSPYIYIA